MYSINVLAPMLLETSLLPVREGGLIVNASSATHTLCVVNYFADNKKGTEYIEGETVGLGEPLNGTDHKN
jgi:hypothetical protein